LANAEYLKEFRKRPGKEQIAREASKRWAEEHPEEFAIRNRAIARRAGHKRKIILRDGDTRVVTERDWLRLCGRYHHCCFYCGEAKKLTMDHIIPVVRGGRHSIGNLIPACRNCNAQKRTRLIVEWRAGKPAAA
jgi:5-methylcytosine-specific restriction endonuclease McrA